MRKSMILAAALVLAACATSANPYDRLDVAVCVANPDTEADFAWLDRALEAWRFARREIAAINVPANTQAVFFDADCAFTSPNALTARSTREITWSGDAVNETVTLPSGDQIPVGVISFARAENGRAYFVMSMPSVWRAGGVDNPGIGLETMMVAVLLHEASHVSQGTTYGARMSALGMQSRKGPAIEPLSPRYGLDIWVEGSFTYFDSDSKTSGDSGHFGLLRIGADYLVTDTFLAGMMVQFDDMEESSKSGGYRIDGQGWMAGPYAEVRFGEHLFFDAKALWGQSDNTVSPFQTYVDHFSTGRWLVSGRVKGLWTDGTWKFTPSAEVIGFRDASDDYVDSLGVPISGQSVTIGRAIFGPEVSYRHFTDMGWLVEPRLAVKGIWTFGQDDHSSNGAGKDGIDPLRARIEAGAKFQSPNGTRLELEGAYDGIGSDQLNATSGKASITIPLN